MEKKHLRGVIFRLTAAILSANLCHGKIYGRTAPDIEILQWPPAKIRVLTGSTIELLWRFRIGPNEKLKSTSWYFLNAEANRKSNNKIIRKDHESGEHPEMNPTLDEDKKNRSSCSFSQEKQVWTMKCRIIKANAEDSADYGIQLVIESRENPISNASKVEVVDIMVNRKDSDVVVQSWIGRKTELNCAIHRKVNVTTSYEWSVVTEEKDITRGITRKPNGTSYTFIPLSKRDFGKYKCKITTASTVEEHTIDLQQIDYPGPPEAVKAIFSDDKPDTVSLNWEQPLYDGGTAIIGYVVETMADESNKWVPVGPTTRLSVAVNYLKPSESSKIRVCSRNKVGIDRPRSCSEAQMRPVLSHRANSASSFTTLLNYLWILPIIFTIT